jgi:hypothetical protein
MNEEFQPSKLKMALLNLKAKTFKRNKGAINFRYAKNFTIAYEVLENNAEQMALIDDFAGYLEQNGKTVSKIVIYPGKDTKTIPVPADRNRWNFCQADFNWYGFPKADGLQRVLKQPSDFFINLDISFSYKTIAMASISNSVARVSLWQENYPAFFDILLKQNETPNLNQYICDLKDCFKHLQ